jgi:hypothetical protein
MPYISLPSSMDQIQSVIPMSYQFPSVKAELLAENNDDAVHQVLSLAHSSVRLSQPSPDDCLAAVIQVFCDQLSDDWLHGVLPVAPVLHVSGAVDRTLWHLRTCHPNPQHLVLFSPRTLINVPIARGHARRFDATRVGQGLALDVGFMFGRSKDKNRAKRLEGINGGNAYCIIYDFKSELLFGVTMSGKCVPITWPHLLHHRLISDHASLNLNLPSIFISMDVLLVNSYTMICITCSMS